MSWNSLLFLECPRHPLYPGLSTYYFISLICYSLRHPQLPFPHSFWSLDKYYPKMSPSLDTLLKLSFTPKLPIYLSPLLSKRSSSPSNILYFTDLFIVSHPNISYIRAGIYISLYLSMSVAPRIVHSDGKCSIVSVEFIMGKEIFPQGHKLR